MYFESTGTCSIAEWRRAEAAMSVALCTTMRGWEIRQLRWRDIDYLSPAILVRASKTEAGQRLIPLNDEALQIVEDLRERAKEFNAVDGSHYVFPACEHDHVDPTRHQQSFRTAWRNLTKAIQCPACEKLQPPADICTNAKCKAKIQGIKSPLYGLRFRPTTPRDHRACRDPSVRSDDYGHRWPCEPRNACSILPGANRG